MLARFRTVAAPGLYAHPCGPNSGYLQPFGVIYSLTNSKVILLRNISMTSSSACGRPRCYVILKASAFIFYLVMLSNMLAVYVNFSFEKTRLGGYSMSFANAHTASLIMVLKFSTVFSSASENSLENISM